MPVLSLGALPQWSPGLMAGGSGISTSHTPPRTGPQWSPGLMAGGRRKPLKELKSSVQAAMEPRPDGRGKVACVPSSMRSPRSPQWSPGLMAGGRRPTP